MRILADDNKREDYPLYDGLFAYFPAALLEVARWSKVGNDKHNPGEKLHWAREKSTDHENKILRHLIDADQEMEGGFIEATALAWRSLALLQTLLEKRGWNSGSNGQWLKEQNADFIYSITPEGQAEVDKFLEDYGRIDEPTIIDDYSQAIVEARSRQAPNGDTHRYGDLAEVTSKEESAEYLAGTKAIPEGKTVKVWPLSSVPSVDGSQVLGISAERAQGQGQPMATEVRGQGGSEAGVLGN